MAKAAAPKKAPKKAAAAKPAAEDESFALHSLQEQFDKNRRFKASKEQLLHFYEQMLLIRRFEERAGQLYGLGYIGGFCHLYIGQEAVAVGLQSALDRLTLVPIAYWLFSTANTIGRPHRLAMLYVS